MYKKVVDIKNYGFPVFFHSVLIAQPAAGILLSLNGNKIFNDLH